MRTQDLIDEAMALPVEERARLADWLLKSLNRPDPDKDAQWAAEAKRRLEEVRSGRVQAVDGERVIERIQKRFAK